MIEFCKKNKVDLVILTKINSKWTTITDIIISKIKELGRETICYYADSKVYNTIKTDQLQGGMVNIVRGKISSLIQ